MLTTTKLPERAALKFAALSDAVEEAHARVLADQRRITSLENQRRHLGEDDTQNFDALTAEIERVSRRRDSDNSQFLLQSRLLAALKTWLLQVPSSCELREVKQHRTLEFRSSESTDEDIDQCREDIVRLQSERASVARAVPPIEDLHAAAAAHVEALAARGRPTVTVDGGRLVIRHGDDKGWAPGAGRNEVALAAWLHPETVLQRLREQIDEMHADVRRKVPVMSAAERDKRLAELDAQILRLEHEEEFLIEVGAQYGFVVPRRESADPRAVLGVATHRREKAAA